MKPKPVHLRGVRAKSIAAASLAVAGFAGLAIAQTTPAMADPTEQYVAVGSDTIQDVSNQFALDLAGNAVGSYNAVNPVTAAAHELITPVKPNGTLCSFARPNGSGEGVAALRYSVNPASGATPPTPAPQTGCVDYARSSSGPGTNQSATGQFVYIPFALDAVATSTGPATGGTVIGGVTTVATAITNADLFTLADLKAMYSTCSAVTEGGVTYFPFQTGVAVPPGDQQIDLYVPQPGSGTLSYWAGQMGFTATSLPACVHQTIVQGTSAGASVEEHDGTAVATDADGLGPFSVSQWIGQRNGHDDRRHGAVLHNIGGVSPFNNGSATTGTINTSFPLTREVYFVAPYDKVVNTGDGKFDSILAGYLTTPNGFFCQDSLQIHSYGFATLGSTTTDTCGSTASTLRAFANG